MSKSEAMPAHLTIQFDDRLINARSGDSIAVALSQAGVSAFHCTRDGQPRGMYCGMGVCSDCLVVVNGRRSQRACMIEVVPGQLIRTQYSGVSEAGTGKESEVETLDAPDAPEDLDLVIAGAGPAGLQAALFASAAGLRVAIIDERHELGGQYYKPRSKGFRAEHALDRQHLDGQALRQRVSESAIRLRLGESLWFARSFDNSEGFELRTVRDQRQHRYICRAVILATGAFERPAMVPGWTLPGVMSIGAGQTLVRRYGVTPGNRILIAGHGPLGMQLAYEMSLQGVDVVALMERSKPHFGTDMIKAAMLFPRLLTLAARYRLRLQQRGVPVLYDHEITRLIGEKKLTGVEYAHVGTAERHELDIDMAFVGDGFAPQSEAARMLGCRITLDTPTGVISVQRDLYGATSAAGVWVAGDAGDLQGAAAAEAQGRLAAEQACQYLGVASNKPRFALIAL